MVGLVSGKCDKVMVLAAWFPSGAELLSHHECALSQGGTRPDMMLLPGRQTPIANYYSSDQI